MRVKPTLEALELFREGTLCLAQMEANGIKIDIDYLTKAMQEARYAIKEKESNLRKHEIYKEWRKTYGEKANLGSKTQLGHVLFDVLKYPCYERTNTGLPKADKEALQKLDSDFSRDYLELVRIRDVILRFLKGIHSEVCDGFLHPSFNLNMNVNFRSNSDGPNFQNFPVRDPEAAATIRKAFIAREKRYLVEIDFSGVEVRVSACVHKDPVLIKYIEDPTSDMHRDTAMELFLLEENQVEKKTTRDWSKNRFVFPQFYGDIYYQCAPYIWEAVSQNKSKLPNSGITIKEHLAKKGIRTLGDCNPKERPRAGTFEYHVKKVEDSFWNERFQVYTEWKNSFWAEYLKKGYYTTLTGFLVQWGKEGILGRNKCLNYCISGPAFHCLLWTSIQVQKWLRKNKMKTLLVGEIHDSLIADVPENELQDYLTKVREVITKDLPNHWGWWIVPVEAEAEVCDVGSAWYYKRQWEVQDGSWKPKEK